MTDQQIAEGKTYAHVILQATRLFADRPAMRYKSNGEWQVTTYAELRDEILDVAAALRSREINKGDRVAIWMETGRDWVVCDLAIQIAGAITVPVYHTLTPDKALNILQDSETKLLFSTSARIEAVKKTPPASLLTISADLNSGPLSLTGFRSLGAEAQRNQPNLRSQLENPEVTPEDLSAIIYTSGTTGEPKGAMLTHASIVANARSGDEAYLGNAHIPHVFLHLPMAHVVGRNAIESMTLMSGGMLAIAEPEREKLVSNLRDLAPTELVTVPYVLSKFHSQVMQKMSERPKLIRKLFSHALALGKKCRVDPLANGGPVSERKSLLLAFYDRLFFRKILGFLGGNVQQIITGAAHISRETLEFFWSIGIPLFEAYGMTETTSFVTCCNRKSVKLTTVGTPSKGMEVKLAPDGEILVRGVCVMKGYWKRPDTTRESIDADGWYRSGDVGSIDAQGYLKIMDRKKEIFVLSTGKNVAPQSVENTLKLCAYVENACVFGDQKNYMTALIVPEWTAVKKKLGRTDQPSREDPDVQKLFSSEIKKLMGSVPDYERVKRFAIVSEPFSVDNNMLTPTLKLRRKQIEEHYHSTIESLYAGPQSNFWFLEEKK
ncbi:MAG TPA: long-chain fatty acid--CoA ligase [bacterium]|nr:long-chain fatty acid--CoA ligase [bacterium]